MNVLIIGSLNGSLTRAKVIPLLESGTASRVVWVTRNAVTPIPGVTFHVVPDRSHPLVRSFLFLWSALKIARRDDFHLIMAYNVMPFGLFAYLIKKMTGGCLGVNVIGGHQEIAGGSTKTENRLLSKHPWLGFLFERFNRFLVRRADFVTVTGTRTKTYLERMDIDPERIFVMPSVPDDRRFFPADEAVAFDLITVSSLIPRKRVAFFIEIVDAVQREIPAVRVAIVGEGPLRTELEAMIVARGLETNVVFLGLREDVEVLFRQSRVFVLTSILEGLPLSIMESMACGVVPVVGNVDDIADLVDDGKNGFLVDPRDQSAYVNAIRVLLGDDRLRRELAGRAAESVAPFYTRKEAAVRWQALHAAVFGKASAGVDDRAPS